jgi:hypothetical protein
MISGVPLVRAEVGKLFMFSERSDWVDDRYAMYAMFAIRGRNQGAGVSICHTAEEGLGTRDDSRQSGARLIS